MQSNGTPIREDNMRDDTTALKCSVCGRRFFLDETSAAPFCSERCKMIDLGRWLGEEISVPHEGGPTKGEAVETDTSEPE